MKGVSCDITSGLVDLIFSPSGLDTFFHRLVPLSKQPTAHSKLKDELVSYCCAYGLTRSTAQLVTERGFVSRELLALLPPESVSIKFPDISERQRCLLRTCIASLDPRPEYQISNGLTILSNPLRMSDPRDPAESTDGCADEVTLALELANTTKKLLECPVCYQTCRPPRIWQCRNGHLTCDTCHAHTASCPLCRSPFTNIRPFTAEKLARQVPVLCKNTSNGCRKKLPWSERDKHESCCEYSVGHCPVLSCQDVFPIRETMQHMETAHKLSLESASLRLSTNGMSFRSSISTATYLHGSTDQQNWWWGPQFVVYEDLPFFFIISRRIELPDSKGHFYFWLWLGANQADAKRFLYNLTVEGIDGEKISYTAKPVSIEMSVSNIRDEQNCLLLSDGAVRRMLTGAGEKLQYRIEIIDKKQSSLDICR